MTVNMMECAVCLLVHMFDIKLSVRESTNVVKQRMRIMKISLNCSETKPWMWRYTQTVVDGQALD